MGTVNGIRAVSLLLSSSSSASCAHTSKHKGQQKSREKKMEIVFFVYIYTKEITGIYQLRRRKK